jgi:alpha-tubulin suppressor-like RCC1 family protein
MKGGSVMCWGWFDDKRDESGNPIVHLSPVTPEGLAEGVQSFISQGEGYCLAMEDGRVKCMADDGTEPVDRLLKTGGKEGPTALARGAGFACSLTAAGSVQCLGNNMYGELGMSPEKQFSEKPVQVAGLESGVKALAAGMDFACALKETGGVVCWGRNQAGQLGRGDTIDSHEPAQVQGLSSAAAVAANGNHACALLETGVVSCWGSNSDGQASGRFPGFPRTVVSGP